MVPQVGESYGYLGTTVFNRLFSASEALSAVVTSEINGEYTLTLEIPIGSKHWDEYRVGQTILVKPDNFYRPSWGMDIGLQRFNIANISGGIEGVLQITAEHISYMYGNLLCAPWRATGITADNAWTRAWNNLTNKPTGIFPQNHRTGTTSSGVNIALSTPTIFKDFLYKTLINVYGGEMLWRGAEGHWMNQISGWWALQGFTRPTHRAVYGGNIISMDISEAVDKIPNFIYPYWGKEDGGMADYQELSGKYIVVNPQGEGEVAVDLTSQFTTMPTTSQLQNAANVYIQQNYVNRPDTRSFTLRLADSEHAEPITLGDSIHIKALPFGIDDTYEIRKVKYDVLAERVIEIEAGAPADSFAAAVLQK